MYRSCVLWILSWAAPSAVAAIYALAFSDGQQHVADGMRDDLQAIQVARERERAQDFARGFAAGIRAAGDDTSMDALKPLGAGQTWVAPGGRMQS